jgi:hypothetical protein
VGRDQLGKEFHMAASIGWKRRVLFAIAAATLLIGAMTLPGLAAPNKTMSFQVNSTGPTTADFVAAVNTAPASTANVSFWIRATNTTPVPGNPNSLRVTAPTSPSPGFVITGAVVDNANSSRTSNPTVVIGPSGAYVDLNLISPLQNGQYLTVRISATTPPSCPSGVQSDDWKGQLWTGTPVGSGQPFQTTSISGTKTTLTSSACTAPGAVSITSDPAASGGIARFQDGANVSFTASPNPVSGAPTPTVFWQSSTASDCLTNGSAAFADITGATGATYSLTPAHTADNNKCFRAQARNGVNPPSTSNVIQLSLSTVTLEFVTEPQDAATNTDITGTDFDPSGDDVQVALKVDGNPPSGGAFLGAIVTITEDGPGSISGETGSLDANGLASFPDLQIDAAGEYNLTATVEGGGPSAGPVHITITPTGVCPGPDGVSGQEDFTTPEFGAPGQGTLNISGLTSNECVGLDVAFSSEGGFQQWDILVNKLTVGPKLTGYATWTWDLPGNDPVPWTQVKWKANINGELVETAFVDLPRCNADAVTDPLPDPTLPNQDYVDLFPTVSTSLGPLTAGVCMYDSALHVSGNTYNEVQKIAIFEDPSGRK